MERPNIKWDDVIGLESAKEILKEKVILPIRFPHLFSEHKRLSTDQGKKVKGCQGILLYGPPGIGKTYLAKACATEANEYKYVSSSDLISKYIGEYDRLVRELFDTARQSKRSLILIDDIDLLSTSHNDHISSSIYEARTELIHQMEGDGYDNSGIIVLGISMTPWSMDCCMRQLFQTRVFLAPLDESERCKLIALELSKEKHTLTVEDITELGQLTDGYTGSDIMVLIRDALMQPLRKIQKATHYCKVNGSSDVDKPDNDLLTPCSPEVPGAMAMTLDQVPKDKLHVPHITMADMKLSLANMKPSVDEDEMDKFGEYNKNFGNYGFQNSE